MAGFVEPLPFQPSPFSSSNAKMRDQGWRHGEDKRFGRQCIAVNFSPKLLRRSHLPSSLYRKLRANSVTHDSKIWRCAWPR
jgi:hypothetical protein